jgi:hypothetical protein
MTGSIKILLSIGENMRKTLYPLFVILAVASIAACSSSSSDDEEAPPRIASSTPANGGTGIAITTKTLAVVFDQEMDSSASLLEDDGENVISSGAWDSDEKTFRITFKSDLTAGRKYSFRLNPNEYASSGNFFQSASKIKLATDTPVSFTTAP